MRTLEHDGYVFHYSEKNMADGEDLIGWYIDGAGYLQGIKRGSLYHEIILKKGGK